MLLAEKQPGSNNTETVREKHASDWQLEPLQNKFPFAFLLLAVLSVGNGLSEGQG